MKAWSEWEIMRHRVAICGRVTDANNLPVAAAKIGLTSMPEGFMARIHGAIAAYGEDSDKLPHQALSRPDGIYYFLDLPAGRYTLKIVNPMTANTEEKTELSLQENGKVERIVLDFRLLQSS